MKTNQQSNKFKHQAIFLDRDGVINISKVIEGRPYPPDNIDELQLTPGASTALTQLKAAGFQLIVVTNQPDVARGKQEKSIVEAIHAQLQIQLPLDEIRVCYHDDVDACECRKPKAGMLLRAAQERGIDLERSFLIGDRWRDIEAGHNAGCQTILIDYGYNEEERRPPHKYVSSLTEATDWILETI